MFNGSQMVIELAFRSMLTDEQLKLYLKAGGTKWTEGEAEGWLRDIAEGRYYLDVNIGVGGTPNPCLNS